MPKRSKNLSLEPEAVRRGERYAQLHGTNVSQLVNGFLAALPLDDDSFEGALTPAVRRLVGAAAGGRGVEDYRDHLEEKYGRG